MAAPIRLFSASEIASDPAFFDGDYVRFEDHRAALATRERRQIGLVALAIEYHRTVEREWDCNGPTCPDVHRLVKLLQAASAL